MTVLLLSTYELGHQPINLAWPLAALKEAGIPATAVDLSIRDFPHAAVSEADLVAISVPMHTALRLGVEAARRVRRANPAARICFYGHYAYLNERYLLESGLADAVLAGEIETRLVRLARGAAADGPVLLERPLYPLPDRSTLAGLASYAGLQQGDNVVPAGYTEATRGCLHTCTHCPIVPVYGGRFFAVPAENVLADIRSQVEAGAEHITFGDPDFLNGPTHALRIARRMHADFPDLTFDFTAKVEHLLGHADLLPELVELGALFAVSAFESTSRRVLEILQKGHSVADLHRVLEIAASAGLAVQPTWVAFTPWTTLDDYLEMLDWICTHGLAGSVPPIQYAVRLLVPPRSALLETPAGAIFGPPDPANFVHPWQHPDPCLDELHAEITALVEALGRVDPAAAFVEIEARAHRLAGRVPPVRAFSGDLAVSTPRLTEDWFC